METPEQTARKSIERVELILDQMECAPDYAREPISEHSLRTVLTLARRGAEVVYALGEEERGTLERLRNHTPYMECATQETQETFRAALTAALNLAVPFTVDEAERLLVWGRLTKKEQDGYGFWYSEDEALLAKLRAYIEEKEK